MAKNNAAQVWFILDLSAQSSYLLPSAASDNASAYIDALLQDTWLFVMDIYNQPERVRDEALYRRGVELVEKMQEQLNTMNESEAFRNDVLLAQCALIDHVVLNTASCNDNALWVYTQELNNARLEIDNLRRDVAAGNRRLQLNARCEPVRKGTAAAPVDDAASPRPTDAAQQDYYTLRERIETVILQLTGLQDYIHEQCRKRSKPFH